MKLGKYLLIPWVMLAVYTILSMYNGPVGIVSYRVLLLEREKILENLEKLHLVNQELEGTMTALLSDAETIRIKARELGYGEQNERFVRIVGLPGGRPSNLRPGMIRTAVLPAPVSVSSYRIITLCSGLLLLGLFLLADLGKR
ncbi:MAG: septum formation initiator family protein [Spirochaetaceae bacterium]|jgi:cell division protein FtsB|nr:septum formation initiator family protein [Spirochaetaceae bacterium]